MSRTRWVVCAGALVVLAAAGCTLPEFFSLNYVQRGGPGGEKMLVGSLESVSASTQASLRQLGMTAVVTPEGDALRIKSRTPLGDNFSLLLMRVKTDQGERTKVRIEWEKRADDQAGVQILGQVEAVHRQQNAGGSN